MSSENKNLKVKSLYHKSETVINEWILCLKQQGNNLNFEDKYQKGRKLGNGKFSTVWQSQNRETLENVAVKLIDKRSLTDKEKDFLREENQIIRLISHPNIVQMRESFETENHIYIVME